MNTNSFVFLNCSVTEILKGINMLKEVQGRNSTLGIAH